MEVVFFEEFQAAYADHVESCWTSKEILLYIFASKNPRLSQLSAQWLYHFHDNSDGADEDGNALAFVWPLEEEVEVKGHRMTGTTVKVKAKECMEQLTGNANPIEMLDDELFKLMQGPDELIWKLAVADTPVNIYYKKTWGDDNYSHLLKIVQATILPHMSQNQLIENHIQVIAQVRKTGVLEERASARCRLHSFLLQPYNKVSV